MIHTKKTLRKIAVLAVTSATLGLAACSPQEGAGFSGIGSEPTVASSSSVLTGGSGYGTTNQPTVSYRAAYLRAATPSAASDRVAQSVLERNGVPLARIETSSTPQANARTATLVAGRRALSHASSRWGAKHTVPLVVGQNTARLKAVSSDGMTFGVVGKIKGPSLLAGQDRSTLKQEVVSSVTHRTGCAYGGETIVQRDQYGTVHRMGVLLSC